MSLLSQYSPQVDIFVRVCHRLADRLYVTSQGGNLAWKLEDDLLLITATKLNKGDVQPEDVVFINLKGETVEGKRNPTGETPMYLKFFSVRKDIVSVIHCHPPALGALAISNAKNWLMRPLYPELTIEVGPVPVVPYGEPLTDQLAQNFSPYLQKYNAFIMENHGLVSMTRGDIYETMMSIEMIEVSVQSILMAMAVGGIKEISREDVIRLGNVVRTRSGALCGAPGVNPSLESLYFL
jgi:L-fuculose-phosphate aldolase